VLGTKEGKTMAPPSNQAVLRKYVDHLRRERGLSPETVYRYKLTVETLTEQLRGRSLLDATLAQLRSYVLAPTLKGKRGSGQEPMDATKKRRVAELRTFYGWLHAEGMIARNPTARLVAPTVHNENPKPFPAESWAAVWGSDLTDSDRVAFGLGMFCGLRRHEVTLLTANHFVDVPRPILAAFKRKGGAKRNLPWLSCVQFFAGRRPDLLPDQRAFTDALAAVRAVRATEPALLDWEDVKGPVYGRVLHKRAAGVIDPQTFDRRFKRAQRDADVWPAAGTPHMLRHAFCTNLLDAGVPLLDVSRLAGHSSVTVTQRYLATRDDPLFALLTDDGDTGNEIQVSRFG
jgi:site-specific recombinase XerD